MAAQSTPFETPRACPFVALELDRDKRSDRPDYRHRCFAEPTPAPRSIAHQEAYCLSPNFAACPVFQDWAVRAAANPVAGSVSTAPAGLDAPADDDHSLVDVESEVTEGPPDSAIEELPEDASVTPAGAEIAAAAAAATGMAAGVASSPPTFATTDWQSELDENEQLAAFDAPHPFDEPMDEPHSSYGQPDAGYSLAPDEPAPPPADFVPPPTQPMQSTQSSAVPEEAAVAAPAFLAGRSSRPQAATNSASSLPPPARPTTRDELVPSWEIDGRYGAEGPPDGGGGGGRLDGVLTAIAVIAILALGVAAVLFLPGLLNKQPAAHTPAPSSAVSSLTPSIIPSAPASAPASIVASGPPASVVPTSQPTVGPVGSPRLYTIKTGDTLARVAKKFQITVQNILDANPEINDPNNIFVGQVIVIPAAGP